MEKITQNDIDWLLNLNKSASTIEATPVSSKKKLLLRVGISIFLLFGFIILPFFLLIRSSVYFHLNYGFNGWLSLGGGAVATILLLLVYLVFLLRKIKNKKLFFRYSLAGVSALVLGFCIYGTFYLSSVHTKNTEIQEVYRSLHPVLRVAVATSTLADTDLVITDIQRTSKDYAAMGLPLNERSLHFVQKDEYVHAIDLRTKGRWEIRNFLLKSSLSMMGFHTIRHIGTADHLHIALPNKKQ